MPCAFHLLKFFNELFVNLRRFFRNTMILANTALDTAWRNHAPPPQATDIATFVVAPDAFPRPSPPLVGTLARSQVNAVPEHRNRYTNVGMP